MDRYPWQLLHRLALRIEQLQIDQAHDDLDRILKVINQDRSRLDLKKLRCAQVISFCLRGAHRGGAPSNSILDEHLQMLQQLSEQRSWAAVRTKLHTYLDQLLDHVRPERWTDVQRFIAWMRDDMRLSIERPRSLSGYARSAGISPEHLSRSFASIAGQSYRQELRQIRTEEAQQLLIDSSLKIATIARRVGLKDPSQFIRDFRQLTGSTPGEYRRANKSDSQH